MNTASAQLAPVLAAGGPLMAHLLERTEARLEQVAGGHGPKLGCHAAGTLAAYNDLLEERVRLRRV